MKRQNIDHTQLLVLSLLAGEDMYGYQMIVELARRSDHTFEMKEGTLYPLLLRLEKKKLIQATYKPSPLGPSRKYYSLTEEGEEYVAAFYGNWKEICESVKKIFEEGLI